VAQFNTYLCPGLYLIKGECSFSSNYPTGTNNNVFSANVYSFKCLNTTNPLSLYKSTSSNGCSYTNGPSGGTTNITHPIFSIPAGLNQDDGQEMLISAWVHEDGVPDSKDGYNKNEVSLQFFDKYDLQINQLDYDVNGYSPAGKARMSSKVLHATGPVIDGWQRYVGYFAAPPNADKMKLSFVNNSTVPVYYDDIRIHPFHANMKSYVYDPVNLRLLSELDANNYATFYEYDEEGTLIRTKAETVQGVKTITETRSAKQKNINDLKPAE